MNKRRFLTLSCLGASLLMASPARADSLDEGPPPDETPLVTITAPADQATYELPETVTVSVDASDVESDINRVWIEIDGKAEAELTQSPYVWSELALVEGMHQIVAKAENGEGLEGTSATVNVAVFPAGEGTGSGTAGSGGSDSGQGESKSSGCSATGPMSTRDVTTSGLAFLIAIFAGTVLRRRGRDS